MINAFIKFIFIFSCIFLFSECEKIQYNDSSKEEGAPSELVLKISTKNSISRAVQSEEQEKIIYNVYILVFDKSGNKIYGEYIDLTKGEITLSQIKISNIPSGVNQKLIVLANIGSSIMTIIKDEIDEISEIVELNNMMISLRQNSIERSEYFLMIGEDNIDIKSDSINQKSICVSRIDSKIRFNVKAGSYHDNPVTLTPIRWRIVNVPRQAHLLKGNKNLLDANETNYFTTNWASFENLFENDGNKFSFYLLENIQLPKKKIPQDFNDTDLNGMNIDDYRYALREKQEKLPLSRAVEASQKNGAFIYAPEFGTYVEFEARVHYVDDKNKEIDADIKYIVHLGYIDNNVDDYCVNRNTNYNYTITINSVNNILVEAEDDKEVYPGVEGTVTVSTKLKQLDCHYETFVTSFTQEQMSKDLVWYVSTPFSKGASIDEKKPEDYKWIYYRLNAHQSDGYVKKLRPYPGEKEIYKNEIDYDTFMSEVENGTDKLLDVDQLLKILQETKIRKDKNNGNNLFKFGTTIYVTTFVNEFYYEKSPIQGDDTPEIDLWKKIVNREDRKMELLQTAACSPDGNSVKRQVIYSLSQASIQTIYTIKSSDHYSAWGTEKMQNMTLYPIDKSDLRFDDMNYNDMYNGRKNTINMWKIPSDNSTVKWNTYIDESGEERILKVQNSKYANLLLNRDNNGNGLIDEDEVRWYLPSINQLVDIWVGEFGIDLQTRLFKGYMSYSTANDRVEEFYVSSTIKVRNKDGIDQPWLLWSSQGATGQNNSGGRSNTHRTCGLRNLGISLSNKNIMPTDFAFFDKSTNILDLKYLNDRSIRDYYLIGDHELPTHHERKDDCKPYRKFKIANKYFNFGKTWGDAQTYAESSNKTWKDNGRVPSLREMQLMLTHTDNYLSNFKVNLLTRTCFYNRYTTGFGFQGSQGNIFLMAASTTGQVLPIQDVP